MSAIKSKPISGYDSSTEIVTFGDSSRKMLSQCTKNELIAVANFGGIKFRGKPAMHFSPLVIESAIKRNLREIHYTPSVPSTPSIPTPSVPSVPPVIAQPTVSAGSVDGVIESIVNNAVKVAFGNYSGGVDENQVRSIVSQNVEKYASVLNDSWYTNFDGFKHEVTKQIDNLRPQVTNITVANRPTVQIQGVLHNRFTDILHTVGAGVHAYLVGSAGTGKSTIGKQVADSLAVPFASKSVSGQTPESALVGYMAGGGNYVGTEFRRIFEHGGVFLLDEVDNGNPNVLNVLNSALANDAMAFADGMVSRHKDFVAIATANTYGNGATAEYVGRNPIDKAFLNRFATIDIDIDENVEDAMLNSVGLSLDVSRLWITAIRKARANVFSAGLRVLVTPRNTLNGAKQINAGMAPAKAFATQITAGLKPEQLDKVMAGVTI
jgi:midasin (ATPase involved in ribosome maturation)